MKKLLGGLICICFLLSCEHKSGSGNIITDTKQVGAFDAVHVAGPFEVEIKQGATQSVIVEADDNLIQYVDVNVSSGELQVKIEKVNVDNAHFKVFITAPSIRRIKGSASADLAVIGLLKSDKEIEVEVSSSSSIKAQVHAPRVDISASSGGEAEVSGETRDLHTSSSSGANISAKDLLSENCTASASSGGSANVYASVSIDAKASSGGDVTFRGAATKVKKSESSGGSVRKHE